MSNIWNKYVTTGNAETSASVTIDSTSTSSNVLLDFVIPKGDQGINTDNGHLQSEIDGLIAGAVINSAATVGTAASGAAATANTAAANAHTAATDAQQSADDAATSVTKRVGFL